MQTLAKVCFGDYLLRCGVSFPYRRQSEPGYFKQRLCMDENISEVIASNDPSDRQSNVSFNTAQVCNVPSVKPILYGLQLSAAHMHHTLLSIMVM